METILRRIGIATGVVLCLGLTTLSVFTHPAVFLLVIGGIGLLNNAMKK